LSKGRTAARLRGRRRWFLSRFWTIERGSIVRKIESDTH
jgi:hypothetical protein